MSKANRENFEFLFKKSGLECKVFVELKNYLLKQDSVQKTIMGCLFFSFYLKGEIYKIGTMVEISLFNDEEIDSIEITSHPFLEDRSSIMLKDEDLEKLEVDFIIPLFTGFINSRKIPYLEERILSSIDEDFFK